MSCLVKKKRQTSAACFELFLWVGEIRLSLDFQLSLETFELFESNLEFYGAVHRTLTNVKGDDWATFLCSFGSLGLLLTGVGGGLKYGGTPNKQFFGPSSLIPQPILTKLGT